jgi:hypothetical protein
MLFHVTRSLAQYPEPVQEALLQTKTNRAELTRALDFFYQEGDSQKIRSIEFLVENMPIHFSASYYWADSAGQRIAYNELDYPTFKDAKIAFDHLRAAKGKLHPVTYTYRDIDSIKADLLIADVNLSVDKLRANNGQFNEKFLDFILPYRTSIEPLQNWRLAYDKKFEGVIDTKQRSDTAALRIGQNIRTWFTNTYKIESRDEPLPRLGALQLLSRQAGACEDIAGLAAFMTRSQGYASAVDIVPAWATASGLHFLNYVDISPGARHHYDAADGYIVDTLSREPAKVVRTTYSIQKNSLAAILKDTSLIPDNFMRFQNFQDVTREYWQTSNIYSRLFRVVNFSPKAAFVSVWNYGKWKPVWYADRIKNDSARFVDMCKGAVYLPMFYYHRNMIPAGWPIVNGYSYTKVLQPDTMRRRTVFIGGQEKYLAYRPERKYTLYYWNNHWVAIATKTPAGISVKLQFDKVPCNALLLLVPDYSQGKERPFIINDNGSVQWF